MCSEMKKEAIHARNAYILYMNRIGHNNIGKSPSATIDRHIEIDIVVIWWPNKVTTHFEPINHHIQVKQFNYDSPLFALYALRNNNKNEKLKKKNEEAVDMIIDAQIPSMNMQNWIWLKLKNRTNDQTNDIQIIENISSPFCEFDAVYHTHWHLHIHSGRKSFELVAYKPSD